MCDLVVDPTQLNREYLTSLLALTTRPSCPPKFGLRLPYRIADVIETNATCYMDFFEVRI